MKPGPEDSLNEDFFLTSKTEKTTKEDILDKDFKKVEDIKEKKSEDKKTNTKKPFLKSGIILVILALICLVIISFAPWAYVKCDLDYEKGTTDRFIFKNYDEYDIGHDNESQKIINIFESNNCSNSTCNYVGLTFKDFRNTPKITFYGFAILALLGLIFIIFQLLEKKRNFSVEMFTIAHSIFSTAIIIISSFLFMLVTKFIAIYFLLYYNNPFITTKNIKFVSPVAITLIFILAVIIKVTFGVMRINCAELEKNFSAKGSKNPFFIYKGGSRI